MKRFVPLIATGMACASPPPAAQTPPATTVAVPPAMTPAPEPAGPPAVPEGSLFDLASASGTASGDVIAVWQGGMIAVDQKIHLCRVEVKRRRAQCREIDPVADRGTGHPPRVTSAVVSPGGDFIAARTEASTLFFDARMNTVVELATDARIASAVRFGADGCHAAWAEGKELHWAALPPAEAKTQGDVFGHAAARGDVAWVDNETLIVSGPNRSPARWRMSDGHLTPLSAPAGLDLTSAKVAIVRNRMVVATSSGFVGAYAVDATQPPEVWRTSTSGSGRLVALAAAPKADFVALGFEHGGQSRIEVIGPAGTPSFEVTHPIGIDYLAISPDATRVGWRGIAHDYFADDPYAGAIVSSRGGKPMIVDGTFLGWIGAHHLANGMQSCVLEDQSKKACRALTWAPWPDVDRSGALTYVGANGPIWILHDDEPLRLREVYVVGSPDAPQVTVRDVPFDAPEGS